MTRTPDMLNMIRGYFGEMLAAEKYLYELVKAQTEAEEVVCHVETAPVLQPLRQTLERHIDRLEKHLAELGGTTADASVKGAVSVLGGKIGALFEKFRSETASRMLRDSYSALGLVAISYTMLHSTALALHDRPAADLALEHLDELTPFIVELSRVLPYVVVNELADTLEGVDRTVGPLAANQTHETWTRASGGVPATPSAS